MGVYVVNVLNRTTDSDEPYDAASQKISMQGQTGYMLQMQSFEVLKRKLKVEDNRYVFF